MKRVSIALVVVGLGLVLAWMKQGPNIRRSSCLSNLKQIGLAANIYARDYDETLPLATNWQDALEPYHRKPERMSCTESQFGYATNLYASGIRLTGIKSQKLMSIPLYFDSTTKKKNAFDTGTSWPVGGAHPAGKDIIGSNVYYMYGFSKWVKEKPRFQVIGKTVPSLAAIKKQVKS